MYYLYIDKPLLLVRVTQGVFMIGLSVEGRRLDGSNPLSKDLARHMLTRYKSGKIAVVTDRPVVLMSATRKQWVKIIRRTARERSSTLNPRKQEISSELERLQSVAFTATP